MARRAKKKTTRKPPAPKFPRDVTLYLTGDGFGDRYVSAEKPDYDEEFHSSPECVSICPDGIRHVLGASPALTEQQYLKVHLKVTAVEKFEAAEPAQPQIKSVPL